MPKNKHEGLSQQSASKLVGDPKQLGSGQVIKVELGPSGVPYVENYYKQALHKRSPLPLEVGNEVLIEVGNEDEQICLVVGEEKIPVEPHALLFLARDERNSAR